MFASPETEKLYDERLGRYVTAMRGGTPDRVPIRFPLQEAAARYKGYTTQQVAADYNLAFSATREMARDLGADACMLNAIWSTYKLARALDGADPEGQVPITLWAHRACVPFITPQTFDTIAWPTLKPILEEIIRRGHQVLFYGEGNWERHYDRFRELPPGGIIYHIDKGDPALARGKLGDRFAISGGLDYGVRAAMKKLFAHVKGDGGYILDASALMLSDVRPENLKAAVEYTLEHGVYSQGHAAREMASPDKAPVIPENPGALAPHEMIRWEEESRGYRRLEGDVPMVRAAWEAANRAVYNYLWTTLLW